MGASNRRGSVDLSSISGHSLFTSESHEIGGQQDQSIHRRKDDPVTPVQFTDNVRARDGREHALQLAHALWVGRVGKVEGRGVDRPILDFT